MASPGSSSFRGAASGDAVESRELDRKPGHAVQLRLSAALLRELQEAAMAGKPCSVQTANSTGEGACLIIGSRMIPLVSKEVSNVEVICTSGDCCTSASVSHKVAVRPDIAAVDTSGTRLADKARNVEASASQGRSLALHPPAAVAPANLANPEAGGRTTAPPRASLLLGRKKPSPKPQAQLQNPRQETSPVVHASGATKPPVPVRRVVSAEDSSSKATPEEIQGALAAGGLPMLVTALLLARPLTKEILTKRAKQACDAAGRRVSGQELSNSVKQVADFQAPGTYILRPSARQEFESVRRRLCKPSDSPVPSRAANPPARGMAGVMQTEKAVVDRSWTEKLSKAPMPSTRNTPSAPDARSKGGILAQPFPASNILEPGEIRQAMAFKPAHQALPEPGEIVVTNGTQSTSHESNGTQFDVDDSPKGDAEVHTAGEGKAAYKRPFLEVLPSSRKSVKTHSGSTPNVEGSDTSWFQQHLNRDPVIVDCIKTEEQFHAISAKYKSNFGVYHRLYTEIQEAHRLLSSLAEVQKDMRVSALRRERAAADLAWQLEMKRPWLDKVNQAYKCLHQELQSYKSSAQVFASNYR